MIKGCFSLNYIFLVVLIASGRLFAQENIISFTSDITVRENGELTVVETITVNCEGNQIRHGIVRELPTSYGVGLFSYKTGFKLVSVKLDGKSYKCDIQRVANGTKVYIRDKGVRLPLGQHTFQIIYNTSRQLGFFNDYDELYWNVTGSGWSLPIEKVIARVYLPKNGSVIKVDAWTGRQGEKKKKFDWMSIKKNAVMFWTSGLLRQGEGFTIAVAFSKGLVQQPTLQQKIKWFMRDNYVFLLVVLVLISFLSIFLTIFLCMQIVNYYSNKQGEITPLSEPPADMTPSEVASLHFKQFKRDFLGADLFDLSIRGFITINKDQHGDYVLHRVHDKVPFEELEGASTYDIKLLKAIFKTRKKKTVKAGMQKAVNICRQRCEKMIKGKVEKNFLNKVVLLLRSIIQLLIVLICVFLLISIVEFFLRLSGVNLGKGNQFLCAVTVALIITAKPVNLLFHALVEWIKEGSFCFYYTKKGRLLQDQIDGFVLYLKTVKLECIQVGDASSKKTLALYERYLSYAMALGLEKYWKKKFPEMVALYKGDLLVSRGSYSSFSSAISSASSSPGSSSAFGGGGSSGGGGGGGGGGGC